MKKIKNCFDAVIINAGCAERSTPFNGNLSRNLTKNSIKKGTFFPDTLYR